MPSKKPPASAEAPEGQAPEAKKPRSKKPKAAPAPEPALEPPAPAAPEPAPEPALVSAARQRSYEALSRALNAKDRRVRDDFMGRLDADRLTNPWGWTSLKGPTEGRLCGSTVRWFENKRPFAGIIVGEPEHVRANLVLTQVQLANSCVVRYINHALLEIVVPAWEAPAKTNV